MSQHLSCFFLLIVASVSSHQSIVLPSYHGWFHSHQRRPNANGAYFIMQFAGGEADLDVFATFGLRADDPLLDHRTLRSHLRIVMTAIFQQFCRTSGNTG